MEVRPGYKQTKVGVIPADWEALPLGHVIEYVKGFAFSAEDYQSHGIRIIRVSDTTCDGIKDKDAIYINESKAKSFRKWSLREGDLIVSTVGSKPPMYDSIVGKATFVQAKDRCALLNQNAVIIRARKWSIGLQRLLHNHLRQKRYLNHIEMIYRGNANQASITLKELFEYPIPLPPTKAEQEAIAEALSDADSLIESLEHLIAKKRQIKQGTMQELLTDKKRLPGFSGEWEVKTLGDLGNCFAGGTPSTFHPEYWGGEICWLPSGRVQNCILECRPEDEIRITKRGLEESAAKLIKAQSVLVAITGATCANIACLEFEASANQSVVAIEPISTVNYRFIYYSMLMERDTILSLQSGSAQGGVNLKTTKSIQLQIPSLPEQTAIAAILSDMDTEINTLEAKLTKARQIKQGMMQELLTGRIRLI